MVKLNTQEIAAILVEELQKVKKYTHDLQEIEARLRKDMATSETTNNQYLNKLDALTKRKLELNTAYFDHKFKSKQILPRFAVWALILQPVIIALLALFFVWLYIDRIEQIAWSDGYNFAKQEQQKEILR